MDYNNQAPVNENAPGAKPESQRKKEYMKFYESIAQYYDFIFDPEDSAECIDGLYLKSAPSKILDIGCATGSLACGLAELGHYVTGIDLDEKMIGIAAGKRDEKGLNAEFMSANMLDIAGIFEKNKFGAAVCVGNTIVHLDNAQNIRDFFVSVYEILKPGGIFIAQILNYDRIMSKKIEKLALIENDKIKFERYYDLDSEKHGGRIIFKTRLSVKENGAVIENEAPLYPAKKQEIFEALGAAGFAETGFYSDIDKTPFSVETSGPLAFSAKKP